MLPPDESDELERQLMAHCQRGAFESATTLAITQYGSEVFGYLASIMDSLPDADEAFAMSCEDLWMGLPRFEYRCSFRTFFYVLARNARSRLLKQRKSALAARAVRVSQVPEAVLIADSVRSTTARYLRTEEKDRLSRLREGLDPVDRELLILRVDRRLSWPSVAAVMAGRENPDSDVAATGGPAHDAAITREAAKLRKRFERIKQRLRQMLNDEDA